MLKKKKKKKLLSQSVKKDVALLPLSKTLARLTRF